MMARAGARAYPWTAPGASRLCRSQTSRSGRASCSRRDFPASGTTGWGRRRGGVGAATGRGSTGWSGCSSPCGVRMRGAWRSGRAVTAWRWSRSPWASAMAPHGRSEATGSPVITDGEQTKPSFATYPIHGLETLGPGGVTIPFADGHTRQLPRLTAGPFRYRTYAAQFLDEARKHTRRPVKQAVISASALSLLYPQDGLPAYSRDKFLDDLVREAEQDIRRCLTRGASGVQIDFTEARLSVKLDPSKQLLRAFVALNNRVLERFTAAERQRIGVHTCPGGDQDSTHSADVDYADLLPGLFELKIGRAHV